MKAADGVTGAVYAQQVGVVFRQMPIALAVNFVNATLTAIVLAPLATQPIPLPFFAVVTLVTAGRLILCCDTARSPFNQKPPLLRRGSQPGVRCLPVCVGGSAGPSCSRSSRWSASSFSRL